MQIYRKESIPFLAIIVLVAVVIVLGTQYYIQGKNLALAENTIKTFQHDQNILDFTKLFVTKS